MNDPKTTKQERPKYRVTALCYINEKLYDPETMPFEPASGDDEDGPPERKPMYLTYDGIPGWYMTPVNDAARAMVEKYRNKSGVTSPDDPIGTLTLSNRPQEVLASQPKTDKAPV